MKQIRIGRSATVGNGEWYLGQTWIPDRPDCYQDLEQPLADYLEEFGEGTHWMETRDIQDEKVDPEMLKLDREIHAKQYGEG